MISAIGSRSRSRIWRPAQTRTIHARYLLACDGANSSVRKQLGIGYEDLAFDEWWVVVDAWQQRPTPLPDMNTQYCWPSRPASAIVGPRNLRRWELKILPHEKPEEISRPGAGARGAQGFRRCRCHRALALAPSTGFMRWWRRAGARSHLSSRRLRASDAAVPRPGHVRRHPRRGQSDLEDTVGGEGRRLARSAAHVPGRTQGPCAEACVAQAKELGLSSASSTRRPRQERDTRLRAQRADGEVSCATG